MVVEGGVDEVLVEARGDEVADVAELGHAREARPCAPGLAAVLGDLDEAVVGADVDQALGRAATRRARRCCRRATSTGVLATASGPHTLPITLSVLRSSWRVRSTLMGVQLSPRSSLLKTRCAAK